MMIRTVLVRSFGKDHLLKIEMVFVFALFLCFKLDSFAKLSRIITFAQNFHLTPMSILFILFPPISEPTIYPIEVADAKS